ncbi:MAG TPA: hypothetical protein VH186_10805 [Chloroflexia bacterium]|nr:hypothetical protein [Chloroflexia bacterium]
MAGRWLPGHNRGVTVKEMAGVRAPGHKWTGLFQRKRLNPLDSNIERGKAGNAISPIHGASLY